MCSKPGEAASRSRRRHRNTMLALLAPSIVFVGLFFVAPLGLFMFHGIDNALVPGRLAGTVAALEGWDGKGLPDETAYRALAQDLAALAGTTALPLLARRLNHEVPGFRDLVIGTGKRLGTGEAADIRAHLIAIDPRWGEPAYWQVLWRERHRFTASYFLAALDLHHGADGGVEQVPAGSAIFVDLLVRTIGISAVVALLCLAIGLPVAITMAGAPPAWANALLILVLVPFWTSLLVRSTAWVILLQNQGVVNQALIALGLIEKPAALIFNRTGLYVAMVHVLLPFMILPLYGVLRGIPPELMRAAASLGAPPLTIFRRVYLPQALPGVIAGASLVFVLAVGYYVIPALVGGPGDQMIGYFVAYYTNTAVNWGMSAALGAILVAVVGVIYALLARLMGHSRLALR